MRSKKSAAVIRATFGLLACICLGGAAHADQFDPRQVPADAKWVLHVDMDAARETKAWKTIDDQLMGNEDVQTKIGQVEQLTGMRFPQDLHDVTLYGKAVGDEAAVVVVHAKFDKNRTLAVLQMNNSFTSKQHGDNEIVSWDDNGKGLFGAFFGDQTVIICRSEATIELALDVLNGKADCIKASSPLDAGVGEPRATLLAYVAAKDIPELAQNGGPQSPLVKKIESAWISLSEKDDSAHLQANLTTATPEVAEQVHSALDGIKAFVSLSTGNADADPMAKLAAGALKTLSVKNADKIVSIDWAVSMDQVKDFIDKAAEKKKAEAK